MEFTVPLWTAVIAWAFLGEKITTRRLSAILFLMCVMQLPISFVFALPYWENPTSEEFFWLVIIGILALFAHYCITKAIQYVEVTAVVIIGLL